MADERIDFWWDVASEGYRWVKAKALGKANEEWFLTTGTPVGPIGYMRRRYQPIEESPGLFRIFADLDPTKESILAFASQYGHLTRDRSNARPGMECFSAQIEIELPSSGESVTAEGESLAFWSDEIRSIKQAIQVWDAVRAMDAQVLSDYIGWADDGVYYHGEEPEPVSTQSFHPEFLQWLRRGDLFEPAILRLAGRLNSRLECGTPARFRWVPQEPGHLHLFYIPGSLIEAVWLQFALAVDRSKDYRKCIQCGTWFELSPDKARSNRLFCSGACKSRNYRDKKARAQHLASQGMDIEAIAAELGTDTETAKGWVK